MSEVGAPAPEVNEGELAAIDSSASALRSRSRRTATPPENRNFLMRPATLMGCSRSSKGSRCGGGGDLDHVVGVVDADGDRRGLWGRSRLGRRDVPAGHGQGGAGLVGGVQDRRLVLDAARSLDGE